MKTNTLQPYLFFGGRCEEALAFYQKALGAKTDMLMRFNESPEPPAAGRVPAGFENKVLHATFRIGDNLLMASDGDEEGTHFNGFSLSLALPTEAEVTRAFTALSEGGEVTMPLAKTFWSPRFGMLVDRFGLGWMLSVST